MRWTFYLIFLFELKWFSHSLSSHLYLSRSISRLLTTLLLYTMLTKNFIINHLLLYTLMFKWFLIVQSFWIITTIKSTTRHWSLDCISWIRMKSFYWDYCTHSVCDGEKRVGFCNLFFPFMPNEIQLALNVVPLMDIHL
jgi:hypothetical protein